MEDQPKTKFRRDTQKNRRHEAVFEKYEEKIKELGDRAPFISKQRLYDEIADDCFYSARTVADIICKRLKNNGK